MKLTARIATLALTALIAFTAATPAFAYDTCQNRISVYLDGLTCTDQLDMSRHQRISPQIDMPKLALQEDAETDANAPVANTPAGLNAGTVYEGVWITKDDKAAKLDARLTLGVVGNDGQAVLFVEDNILVQYSVKRDGKFTEPRKIDALKTDTGFKWEVRYPNGASEVVLWTPNADGTQIHGNRTYVDPKGEMFENTIDLTIVPSNTNAG